MTRALTFFFAYVFMLMGCTTQRTICPAYQSAFIFDISAERKNFVLYNENKNQPQEVLASSSKTLTLPARDSSWEKSVVLPGPSLPLERRVKKDRYLLLPKRTYKKALRALQTVQMQKVYPKKEDSLNIKKELDSAARSITDTITSVSQAKPKEQQEDSVYVISKEKEKFNADQDNYMWYFRDILVLPDVKIGMDEAKAEGKMKTANKKTKQGFFQKIKGLFKKKPKTKIDSTKVVTEEINTSDSTAAQIKPQPLTKKKKGLGGLLKKKPKAPVKPVKKIEGKKEEDDGF